MLERAQGTPAAGGWPELLLRERPAAMACARKSLRRASQAFQGGAVSRLLSELSAELHADRRFAGDLLAELLPAGAEAAVGEQLAALLQQVAEAAGRTHRWAPMPLPMPAAWAAGVAGDAGEAWDYNEKTHLLRWRFKKCGGGTEWVLRARLTLERPYGPSLRADIGPVNLRFTVPMHSASRIALKYLQILKPKPEKGYNPYRWVRYVTSSNSYTFRT
ncbi:AP-4 complex subunit mu [Tetrabaena socialis]|uniref:AP-4 complex subunit mu n=1 Tax=Tetrabaena socialis TaxID=47790 RepID=A0A2J8AI54_9CHLO|nr:AP-4 complex subunit mu [Tetrabaena socialis]|eukprot:PNH12203.1 AP-4 complex subunit mu [Tetrabaena socialis]